VFSWGPSNAGSQKVSNFFFKIMLYGPSHAPAFACSPATHVPVCRNAIAAANGAPAMAIRVSAQRIRNGVAKGTKESGPALAAATPKISTGTQSGKIKIASNRPPRRRLTVSAAPMAPIKVRAGVPASSESVTLHSWFMGR